MTIDRFEAAHRLIKAATGEEYGDGEIVTDIAHGYASDPETDAPVVLGNWNDKYRYVGASDEERAKADRFGRILVSNIPSRLEAALERLDIEVEWYDQASTCSECHRVVRTEPDSYGWTPEYLVGEYGYLCRVCALEDIEAALEGCDGYINNSDKAVSLFTRAELEAAGWTRWEGTDASDGGSYANGWYPGQDDKPTDVDAAIRAAHGDDVDVLFVIDSVGQFDTHFGAYYRLPEFDDDTDD